MSHLEGAGHTAAYISQILSLDEAFGLVIKRGELSAVIRDSGSMVVIFSDLDFVKKEIEEYKKVSIAVINSSRNVVVSGLTEEIQLLTNDLEKKGIEYKKLNISNAFHSPLVEQVIPEFSAYLKGLHFQKPVISFISNLTGIKDDYNVTKQDYWVKHIRNTVLFKDSLDFLRKERIDLFIEVSPKITLSHIVLDEIPDTEVFSSLVNTNNSLDEFFDALGSVYKVGKEINFSNYYKGTKLKKVLVPTYAFDRKKYWIDSLNNDGEIKSNSFFYELLLEEDTKFNNPDINFLSNQKNAECVKINKYLNPESYKEYSQALGILEHKAINYIYELFIDLGVPTNLKFNHLDLFNIYGVNLKYKNLINLFLQYLHDRNLVCLEGDVIELLPKREEEEVFDVSEIEIIKDELKLIDISGQNLESVVTGTEGSTGLIFDNDSEKFLSGFYKNSVSLKLMNQLTATFINNLYKNIPAKDGLKILELGAGTGSTLDYLKHILPQRKTQYLYTDVSNKFLNDARKKFADLTYVKYQKLDINEPFEKQGIEKTTFDIVIANNAIHVAKDINLTLNSVRESLTKNGKLVMIEGNEPVVWIDLIFGLFDGWWHFKDFRVDYPLLDNEHWLATLKQNRFDGIQFISPFDDLKAKSVKVMPQSLIVADASKDIEYNKEKWLLIGDKKLIRKFKSRNSFRDIDIIEAIDGKRIVGKKNTFSINYDSEKDYDSLFGKYAFDKVVYFLPTFSKNEKNIEYISKKTCLPLLNLFKALQKKDINNTLVFSVIGFPNGDINPISGTVFGMSKTAHAEIGLSSAVLEIDSSEPDHFKYVYEEVLYPESDDFVFKSDTRFSLRTIPSDSTYTNNLCVHKNRSYVVSGAYGEVGILIVEWLSKKGAGSIVLLGRSAPNLDASNKIERIKLQYGVNILNYVVDISDRREVSKVFKEIKSKGVDVGGIINVAGMIDDSTILNQSWEKFNNVFKAKIYGNINLFNTIDKNPLDFFVAFSSVVGIFGNAGQINHAAANSFLRYFSDYAKKRGVPVTCIHWGAWANIGTLAKNGDVLNKLERKGVYALDPNQIQQNLDKIFGYQKNNIIYSKIDWDKFVLSNEANVGLLRYLTKTNIENSSSLCQESVPVLKTTEDIVLYQIADILGVQVNEISLENNLFDLGMDSLTSIQLRNSLQDAFNSTLPSNFVYLNKTPNEIISYFRGRSSSEVPEKNEFVSQGGELLTNISIQQKRWLSLAKKEYGKLLIPIIFSSNLEEIRFKTSLSKVVERNDILRVVFTSELKKKTLDGSFLGEDFRNMFFDFSDYTDEKKRYEFKRISDSIRNNPPNPYVRPSWKIVCIKDTKGSFVVLLFIQHLEFDGVSVTQFIDELKKEYFGLENDKGSQIVSYDEYIKTQETYVKSDDFKKDLIFYKELYKDFGDVPLLSLDKAEIKTISRQSECISVNDIISLDELQRVSKTSELSLFAIVTAAYAKLVSSITGRDKNIIGTILSSRPNRQFNRTIGPFVQPFPMPIDISNYDLHVVSEIHDLVLEMNSRSLFPVVALIDSVKIFSKLEYDTYFSDTFIMLNNYRQEKDNELTEVLESLGEINRGYLSGINNDVLNEIAGLFLIIDYYEKGIRFNFWYHKDRFSDYQVKEWVARYKKNLDELIHNLINSSKL